MDACGWWCGVHQQRQVEEWGEEWHGAGTKNQMRIWCFSGNRNWCDNEGRDSSLSISSGVTSCSWSWKVLKSIFNLTNDASAWCSIDYCVFGWSTWWNQISTFYWLSELPCSGDKTWYFFCSQLLGTILSEPTMHTLACFATPNQLSKIHYEWQAQYISKKMNSWSYM